MLWPGHDRQTRKDLATNSVAPPWATAEGGKMKTLLGLIMASALAIPAQAAPAMATQQANASMTILVEGGCGRDYHRGEDNRCHPNWREWEPGWKVCPPGWHLGGEGRRCWPN
jgi:hypothetical protein